MFLNILIATFPIIFYLAIKFDLSWVANLIAVIVIGLKLKNFRGLKLTITPPVAVGVIFAILLYLANFIYLGGITAIPSIGKLIPAIISLSIFILFVSSLSDKESIVEGFARRMEDNLPKEVSVYCRYVTIVWSIYFIINIGISLDSIHRSPEWWAIYNGIISYIIIGLIFLVEYIARIIFKKNLAKKQHMSPLTTLLIFLSTAACYLSNSTTPLLAEVKESSQLTVQSLGEHIKRESSEVVSFKQERTISGLSLPIVSEGQVVLDPPHAVYWISERPFKEILSIAEDQISQFQIVQNNNLKRTSKINGNESFEFISAALKGDIQKLSSSFTSTVSGTLQKWSLLLSPSDSLISEFITEVKIEGESEPHQVTILLKNGDQNKVTFSKPSMIIDPNIRSLIDQIKLQDE